MNDLPLCVEHGHVTMYADDTSSSNCIKSVNDIVSKVVPDMQNIIDWLTGICTSKKHGTSKHT